MLIASFQREDGSSNGLIQLYNNLNPISHYDKRRLRAISKFFGGCIEQLEDKQRKLNIKSTILDEVKVDSTVDPPVIKSLPVIYDYLRHLTDNDGVIRNWDCFLGLEKDVKMNISVLDAQNRAAQACECDQSEVGKWMESKKVAPADKGKPSSKKQQRTKA